ncbi:MAG: choice-of-anchor R domain-containing protein, partial [Syntrophobacteraceae bacterium]
TPHYLGPLIIAQRDRPVRVKFTNNLPTGAGGNLFIPTDTTYMGAGMGPDGTNYTQNRAVLHLHGGATPWISDGTPHQWTVPKGEVTNFTKGLSASYVPDMWFDASGNLIPSCAGKVTCSVSGATNNPGPGSLTFYYTNQQSARLMFYHDHAYGITRLNVYAGEAAGCLVTDSQEQGMVNSGVIPAYQIPLIIQDKTSVDVTKIALQDPTWNWGTTPGTPHAGDLWFPHVYMSNQWPDNPDLSGAAPMGRWDYGPWFWPPLTTGTIVHDQVPCLYEPGSMCPGTPNPSGVPEAFMDTPVVNGTAYPFVRVAPKAYRLRILNACNDRTLNLSLFYAAIAFNQVCKGTAFPSAICTEVAMTNAAPHTATTIPPLCTTATNAGSTGLGLAVGDLSLSSSGLPPGCWPTTWPTDGRDGGVPDPLNAGPAMIEIGTEGGFLPSPVVITPTPIGYEYNRRSITVLNIGPHALTLGPAERADVIVDLSSVPPGSTLMLYNDAPAPVPAFDPRYDYYTSGPDQTLTGGAPPTLPGYGPNTRTVMQIRVTGTPSAPYNFSALQKTLSGAFANSQPTPIVPESYMSALIDAGTSFVTSTTLGTVRNNYSGFVGMRFTVGATPLAVNALGRMMAPGNVQTHVVKFVNANNGTDVPGSSVSVPMLGGTVGQFQYANLSTPVTLAANTAYYVVSQESVGGDTWYDWNTIVTTSTAATGVYAVYGSGAGLWHENGVVSANHAYVLVDFKTPYTQLNAPFVTGTRLGTVRNNYSGYVGMKFTVGPVPVAVAALGRIMAPGNINTHTVKLVNASDGTDVPGGAVSIPMLGGRWASSSMRI